MFVIISCHLCQLLFYYTKHRSKEPFHDIMLKLVKISFDLDNILIDDTIILIKSVFNKDKNICYYNIFLEKRSDKIPKNDNNK